MDRNTYIIIALCVFAFLVGSRLRKRFGKKKDKQQNVKIKKNQRGKARYEIPEEHKERPGKAKTKIVFTKIVIVVLFLMVLYMIPALVRDLMLVGKEFTTELFLRLVIVVFAIYTLIMAYLKISKKK